MARKNYRYEYNYKDCEQIGLVDDEPIVMEVRETKGGGSHNTTSADSKKTGGGSHKQGVGRDRARFEASHEPTEILSPPKPSARGAYSPSNVPLPDGKASKYTSYALEVGELPWLENWDDTEKIRYNASKYFEICAKWDCKPGVAGLALALKMDRKRFWAVVNDQPKAPPMPEESRQLMKYLHQYLNAIWEQTLQGGINPAAGIFLGINNFGYHNEQNIIVQPVGVEQSADLKAIEDKYKEMPED